MSLCKKSSNKLTGKELSPKGLGFCANEEQLYKNAERRELPGKDLLCRQLETFFRSFDETDKSFKFFYNYEQSIEYKLTQKLKGTGKGTKQDREKEHQ